MLPIKSYDSFHDVQRTNEFKNLKNKITSASENHEKALEAAKGFETMMVKQMLKSMTESLQNKGFFGKAPGSDVYQDMFMDSMARQITDQGRLGLADMIVKNMEESNNMRRPLKIRELNENDKIITHQQSAKLKTKKTILEDRLEKYEEIITRAAKKFNVDKGIIKSIIAAESYANPKAVSRTGAKGLMQLMDKTADSLGVKNSFDPEENIMGGTKFIKHLLKKYESIDLALAAYNAGPSNVEKYNGVPPFKETQNYIKRIKQFYSVLQ
jgi:soluble lytic murein transglycosylase-like protein